jgi:hypothetical protein
VLSARSYCNSYCKVAATEFHPVQSLEIKSRSRRGDSNSRPAVYETAALPLSYVGGEGEFSNRLDRALSAKKSW